MIKKLAIGVTFHFNESRFRYLRLIGEHFRDLADEVVVRIVTNATTAAELGKINSVFDGTGVSFSVFSPTGLGHPFFLAWSHLPILRGLFEDDSFTHYMYLEDDILIKKDNVDYWLEARTQLRKSGLIPSFLRVEQKEGEATWYVTDVPRKLALATLPTVEISPDLLFVNLPYPYQGMYLLDRELMDEFLSAKSVNPDNGSWGIREKATQGITFLNVPAGYTSRNLVPYRPQSGLIDARCLIHHTPNNYANDPRGRKRKFARIPVHELFDDDNDVLISRSKRPRRWLRFLRRS